MHGCTTNAYTCRVKEVSVDKVSGDLFKVTLTALDDLTAGQSSRAVSYTHLTLPTIYSV